MNTDKQIKDAAVQALLWDARVSPARIDVKSKNGKVVLNGTVDTYYKKWSAIDTVMKIPHVTEVKDDLVVKTSDHVNDTILQKNIDDAMQNDSRLQQTRIKCTVENGRVKLTGNVITYYQKIAAEETCRWIKGVVKVENDIEVIDQGEKFDNSIKQRIYKQIQESSIFEDTNIHVKVDNGLVLLSGSVYSIYQKIHAEVLSSLVANVTFVKNELQTDQVDDKH